MQILILAPDTTSPPAGGRGSSGLVLLLLPRVPRTLHSAKSFTYFISLANGRKSSWCWAHFTFRTSVCLIAAAEITTFCKYFLQFQFAAWRMEHVNICTGWWTEVCSVKTDEDRSCCCLDAVLNCINMYCPWLPPPTVIMVIGTESVLM